MKTFLKKSTEMISEPPLLRFYDLEDEVPIETNASDYGLGAVLLQAGGPAAFASRKMTETERRYSQIDKECLALVYKMYKIWLLSSWPWQNHNSHWPQTSRNNPSEKYQQRTLEVTTHDASPAKVPPQSCVQERNSDVL